MRIVLVNSVCGVGSTGRICADLTKTLLSSGNDVRIAYGRGECPNELKQNAIRIGDNRSVSVHAIRSRLTDSSGLGSYRATKTFISWLDDLKPDVIHLHNIHGYYIHVPTLFNYLKLSQAKVIWTLHDTWAISGHSGTCDKVQCTKWKTGCSRCPLKKEYPLAYLDFSHRNWVWKKELFSGLPHLTIVTPSQWLADAVGVSFLKSYKTFVIHNGIDTDTFRVLDDRSRYNGSDGKIRILGVANAWSKYKGLEDFVKLSKELDASKYRITLVGLTSKQIESLPKTIVGIERTKDVEELVRLYNNSDYFVNMTYCDVFPTVNLEALACGTKVITYSTGGCPETVRDYGGIVVPRGDLSGIVNTIRSSPSQKIDIDAVHEDYSIRRFSNDYLNLYNEALNT